MNLLNFACLACLVLCLFACTAEEPPTANQLLCNRGEKTWINYRITTNGFPSTKPCEEDDAWIFTFGGKLSIDPNYIRCFLYDKPVSSGWFLGGNDELLYLSLPGDSIPDPAKPEEMIVPLSIRKTQIIKLTADSLILRQREIENLGQRAEVTEFFFINRDKF